MKSQVIIVTVTLLIYVCATNYKRGYGGVGEKAVGSSHGRTSSGRYEGGQNYPRKPHQFQYSVDDGQGNSHYRYEYSDEFGAVSGGYGYNDASGLYRRVVYVADARGFRANVNTNEPGATNVNALPPEKPASAGGTGSDSPSAKNVTDGVKYFNCTKKYSVKKCLQYIGTG